MDKIKIKTKTQNKTEEIRNVSKVKREIRRKTERLKIKK
jgi:hypothetical protein